MVLDELLPAWRSREWDNAMVAAAIADEMKRVQESMDAEAYRLLNALYLGGLDVQEELVADR